MSTVSITLLLRGQLPVGVTMRPSHMLIMFASAFIVASTTTGIGQEDNPLDRLLSKDDYSAKFSPTHSDRAMKLGRGVGRRRALKRR
jgi:hypothetical protein